jgi:DNA replication ATP-dependent helicase Dna2
LKSEGVDFIRIGRHEAVHPDVRDHCLSTAEVQSVDAIKARMDQVQVVGVTCLGMYHPLLAHKKLTHVSWMKLGKSHYRCHWDH